MNAIEAVLFDLDGTLLDTAPDFVRVVNQQRLKYEMAALEYTQIRAVVSNGARALIQLSFGFGPEHEHYDQRHQELLDLYFDNVAVETCLFPGMDELLRFIEAAGVPWGIVTNKPRRFADLLLAELELSERCAVLVCPDDVTHRKPHPEPMLLACSTLGCDPRNSLYVGDHVRDIEAGRSAGMVTVAARYGYLSDPDEALAWAADLNIDQPGDLVDWIRQQNIPLRPPANRQPREQR